MKTSLSLLLCLLSLNAFAATSSEAEGRNVCVGRLIQEQINIHLRLGIQVTQVIAPTVWGYFEYQAINSSGYVYHGMIEAEVALQTRSRFNPRTRRNVDVRMWICSLDKGFTVNNSNGLELYSNIHTHSR